MHGKKLMKTSDLILRCYLERESDGSWFAICLDLNLTAQADSAKEAKEKLHAHIARYVREALTVDRAYIEDLLPRRAPLSFFIRYYAIKAICMLRGINRHQRPAKRIFNEHLPVVPA
jgi:hypothetical protein